MNKPIILAAFALFSSLALAEEPSGECDGRQMYNYVDVALQSGTGVLNVAKDPEYGGGAVSIALNSKTMGIYNSMIYEIREHDLAMARRGCTSLKDGPTKGMMSTLRQIDSKIGSLVKSQHNDRGVITSGFSHDR